MPFSALAALGLLALAPFTARPLAAQTKAAATPFTVDDAIDLTRVSDPQLSPDGRRVLFQRSELDWEKNRRTSRLWLANADGSDARPFTAEAGDGSASWSPDGRWVAFTRSVGEKGRTRQIFLLRLDGGEARQLTRHATSVGRYEWTADSKRIVFLAQDSVSKDERTAREQGADEVFVDEGPNGQDRGTWSNLWWVAVDLDSATSHPITAREHRINTFAVAPDGQRIAFTYRTENNRNDQFRSEIAVVGIEGGEIRQLTHNEAPESNLGWSPDSRTLTFVAPDLERWELAQGNLYAMDLASGAIRQIGAGFQGGIRSYEWAPNGKAIRLVATERTISNLYELDPATGRVRQLSKLEGLLGSASFSRDHGQMAYTFASPTEPGDIFTTSLKDLRPVRVTDANAWIRDRALATPEVVRWKSSDGLEIEGILYLPPGGRSRPGAMTLEIHGGPAGAFTRGFNTGAQILAAHGYAVLQPNVRGSTGYGDALLRGNMFDIGGGDYQDLMTGVDAMIGRGIAHPDSLVVKGWSYGGILGGWTITRTDRFKAASLGAMVSDWRSEFGPGFNHDVTLWYLGGDPWSNKEFWIERSNFTHLDKAKTPTILFHGDEDRTDTIGQTFNFHAGLKHFDVPVRFLRFPREGHGITEPRHARTRLVEELRWFQLYLRGEKDWQAPQRPDKTKTAEVAARQ
jgi:dipeptidyl aminopeptidase/acylaminoacyl peptidase